MTTAPSATVARPAHGADEWGECLVPMGEAPADVTTALRRHLGATPSWVGRLGVCRWLGYSCVDFISHPTRHIDNRLSSLISLIVSQDNSCRYCYGIQRATFRILGYSDEYLSKLERDFNSAGLPPETRAALHFARKISRADPRPRPEDYAELTRVGFDHPAIVEIAFTAVADVFMNRISTILALPPEPIESITASRFFRLIRPVMRAQMTVVARLQGQAPPPEPLPANTNPVGTRVVAALGDLPAAGVIARALHSAFASELLPRRTKALIAAVVARALGCAAGEADARALLAADGFTSADVDEIVANLGSPKLDARDARLVPFARDTVRYQPPVIQRRAREATRELTPGETIEAVGVASLMNAACRLSVLLELC